MNYLLVFNKSKAPVAFFIKKEELESVNSHLLIKYAVCIVFLMVYCIRMICHVRINALGLHTPAGWRTTHPQTERHVGKEADIHSLSKCPLWRLSILILGHGSGAKENAPAELAYVGSVLRLPDPPYVLITYGHLNIMIYTFLIAASRGRIADISRVRTISAFAKSEQEARARLSGLPLVFMSRTPAITGGASC